MRVSDLHPGDVLRDIAGGECVVIAVNNPHPLYPKLYLVVWWMKREKRWSLDALHPDMELSHMTTWLRRSTDDIKEALHSQQE
jgi:hypothetical protein